MVLNTITNAYLISYQSKYYKDEVKSEIIRLVKSFNFNSFASYALRKNLINLMLERKRTFRKNDFKGFEKVCLEVSQNLEKEENIHGSIRMLELGEIIEKKVGIKTYNWRERIAKYYEKLMDNAEEDKNLAAITFCQKALECYKQLKDEDKIKQLEEKYSNIKTSMELSKYSVELPIYEHRNNCKKMASELVQKEPEEILYILAMNKDILPKYKDVEKLAEDMIKNAPLFHLATTEVMDQLGHTAQHFSDEDEKRYYELILSYKFELEVDKIILINEIMFAVLKENKLNTIIMRDFLKMHSWYGKNIQKKLPNQKIIEYNWLNLILPSLHEYFVKMEFFFNSNNYPNLVLCIDSLTLKIEGLIRDICQFSGVTTFFTTKDKKGRNITGEKNIHTLLYEEKFKELFDEDDLLFFKFLLVEKAGYNLRPRVAHSLMLYQEYSIEYMHLLIIALLRLGKYDFVKKSNNSADKI